MGIENSNQGPGWHDHDTPYGTIHSYDGDTGTYGGGGTGGNAGGGHTGLTANTWVDIATTKDYKVIIPFLMDVRSRRLRY